MANNTVEMIHNPMLVVNQGFDAAAPVVYAVPMDGVANDEWHTISSSTSGDGENQTIYAVPTDDNFAVGTSLPSHQNYEGYELVASRGGENQIIYAVPTDGVANGGSANGAGGTSLPSHQNYEGYEVVASRGGGGGENQMIYAVPMEDADEETEAVAYAAPQNAGVKLTPNPLYHSADNPHSQSVNATADGATPDYESHPVSSSPSYDADPMPGGMRERAGTFC